MQIGIANIDVRSFLEEQKVLYSHIVMYVFWKTKTNIREQKEQNIVPKNPTEQNDSYRDI